MNGFKNYETWAASLWFENDESLYNHISYIDFMEVAEQFADE